MPGGAEGGCPAVVDLLGIQDEVEEWRLVDELGPQPAMAEARSTLLAHEGIEPGPQLVVGPPDLLDEGRPVTTIGRGVAARERWNLVVLHLGRVAADDPGPGPAGRDHRRETDHVVLDDHVRPEFVEDRPQAGLDVASTIDQRGPGGRDELAELLEGGLSEDRRRVTNEIEPELARDLGDLGRRAEAHQALLEALRLEPPGERLLDDEQIGRAS